ncbi:MAG: hypothetical protein ACQER9_03965 [Nanobdellota archaeon]
MKSSIKEIENKINEIENYLGPKLKFSFEKWPEKKQDRWILEYLLELKNALYKKIEYKKKKDEKNKIFLMEDAKKTK